jgi:hypothetical protein
VRLKWLERRVGSGTEQPKPVDNIDTAFPSSSSLATCSIFPMCMEVLFVARPERGIGSDPLGRGHAEVGTNRKDLGAWTGGS